MPLNACAKDETSTGTDTLKAETQVGTTRGMVLPGVEELDMEG